MLEPDSERIRIHACQNGWIFAVDMWDEEHQQYRESKSWVYQDLDVLINELSERLGYVLGGK